jgi:hypothetical protein
VNQNNGIDTHINHTNTHAISMSTRVIDMGTYFIPMGTRAIDMGTHVTDMVSLTWVPMSSAWTPMSWTSASMSMAWAPRHKEQKHSHNTGCCVSTGMLVTPRKCSLATGCQLPELGVYLCGGVSFALHPHTYQGLPTERKLPLCSPKATQGMLRSSASKRDYLEYASRFDTRIR